MIKTSVKRRISICYILEEDSPFESSPIKICRSKRLAEHYKKILSPKWKDTFGFDLFIREEKFYEDDDFETEIFTYIEKLL